MSVNFGGFKNSGNTDLLANGLQFYAHRVWFELTDKDGEHLKQVKPLFEKYGNSDSFLKVDVSPPHMPIGDSFISINGKKMRFDDLTKEDVKDVEVIRKVLLPEFSKPSTKLDIDQDYFNSTKPYENLEIEGVNVVDEKVKRDYISVMFWAHKFEETKQAADMMAENIKQKLTESLSKPVSRNI